MINNTPNTPEEIVLDQKEYENKPWHIKWEKVSEEEYQGRCELRPELLFQKIYDPILDLWRYSTANSYGGWSLFACIREE